MLKLGHTVLKNGSFKINFYVICSVSGWRHKSSKEKLQITILMIFGTPIWLLAFLLLPPTKAVDRYLQIPLLKFVANIVMYLVFIFISSWNQIKLITPVTEDLKTDPFRHGSPIKWFEIYIFLWMIGSMFQEIKEMVNQGFRIYLTDVWNFLDFIIAVMFLIASTARLNDALQVFEYEAIERRQWDFYDNLLVYEASLCMGTLVAVNRILHFFRASRLLGKLQMSLGSSFGEITKFMALFLIMYISFASAINSLYWKDQFTVINACRNRDNVTDGHKNCPDFINQKVKKDEFQFTTMGGCLYQLYWTLFGYSDIVFASKVYKDWTLHTFVGSILFILFNFVAVVVLLNVLIGMITKTLDNIEENIDTEWKFARSNIYAEYIGENSSLPSPFNIFPSLRKMMLLFAKLWELCTGSDKMLHYAKPNLRAEQKKRQEHENRLPDIMRAMKDQYMRNQMKEAEAGEVTLEDLDSLKNDVSGLKFEVLSYVRCVPSTLDAMCKRQFQQLQEIEFLQNRQREQWNEMLAHEERMQEIKKMHSAEIERLQQKQDESFALTREHHSHKLEEATSFQTKQAYDNQVEAKEKISQAKTEQINRVNDIYKKQDDHFKQLREEQNLIKSIQKENASTANENCSMLKELIENQDRKITQFKCEQDEKNCEMEQKHVEMIEQLKLENEQKHLYQCEKMRELHSQEEQHLKTLHCEQVSIMKSMECEYRNCLNEQVGSLKKFYEFKMGEYLIAQQTIISEQSKFIRELVSGMQDYVNKVSTNHAEKILESQKNIPNLFRNETRIVCQSMQELYNSKTGSLPSTPLMPRDPSMPSRLPKPTFRTPVPINQVRPLSSHYDTRSVTGLSNYSSTSSLNSIGETSVDTGVSSFIGTGNAPSNNVRENHAPKMIPAVNKTNSLSSSSWLPRFNKVKAPSSTSSSKSTIPKISSTKLLPQNSAAPGNQQNGL